MAITNRSQVSHRLLFCSLFILGLLYLPPGPDAVAQEALLIADPLRGKEVFEEKGCQACHAIHGEGGDIARDLGRHEYYGSALDLAADLWNHSPIMREVMEELDMVRPVFNQTEMTRLMAYLYYQRYYKKTGDSLNGKRLLTQKGCLTCHSLRGKGGDAACRLDRLREYVSPLFMAQAMWNHGPEMARKMQELQLDWPTFANEEIIDLTNYLRVLRKDSHPRGTYFPPGNPVSGKVLFAKKGCTRCHSVDGKGGNVGPDIAQIDLSKSVTEIAGLMWNHGADMMTALQTEKMAWPQFQGDEMGDVIAYLYSVSFVRNGGDAIRGREVFEAKGCANCHTQKGGEKPPGPALLAMARISSPIQMSQVMWNHAPEMEATMTEMALEWPEFDQTEMADLYEFLARLKNSAPDAR